MSSRRESQLHNAQQRYPIDDLTAALTDLQAGFGSIFDFADDVTQGHQDTKAFDHDHPGHPMHSAVHRRRLEASGFFWMLAEGDATRVPDSALPDLHRSLFDASAAVRYDIAMCLGHLNRPASVHHLRRLVDTESQSAGVRQAATWALGGEDTRRYGRALGAAPSASIIREDSESADIRRDRMHAPLLDTTDVYYALWAACAWEVKRGISTTLVNKNLEILAAPNFTFKASPDTVPQRLHTSRQRSVLGHFEQAIEDRLARPVTGREMRERFRSTLMLFKLFGYHDYFAGHEGGIRLRLIELLDTTDASLSGEQLVGDAKLLAAYYSAFTALHEDGVPADLDVGDAASDVRVFMSHSSLDKAHARRLAAALQLHGIKVWLDEREMTVGDSLWDEIGRGIEESSYLILLISPRSVASQWVKREMNAALATEMDRGRKIVLPVVVETTDMPMFLRERLYCDLVRDFDSGVAELLRALR